MKTLPAMIRVLVADDHPLVREGIIHCLSQTGLIEIVGEATDGEEAVRLALELSPAVVLMDINMPRLNGLAATERLHHEAPDIRVLVLSMHAQPEYVLQAARAGARGFVVKDAAPGELVHAIQRIHAGESFFSPGVARHVLDDYVAQTGRVETGHEATLTRRETEVLALLAEGHPSKAIAAKLGIGLRTVETHRAHLMEKLQLQSVAQLTRYAITRGITPLD